MNKLETFSRFLVTSLAVWRLSQILFGEPSRPRTGEAVQEDAGSGRFWAARAADFVCWISVWLSSQTAIWIACGFAGVFLSWLSMAGISRLFVWADEKMSGSRPWASRQTDASSGDKPSLRSGDGMQVNHG